MSKKFKEVWMKCCGNDLPEPDIIDGTAYFVCPECGNVREVKNYRVYTKEERIELFENEYGVKLPKEYIDYAGTDSFLVVQLPPCNSEATEYYFGEGFYDIGRFAGLNPDDECSIFDTASLVDTWDLPENIVLIEGDGHTWLALDYRGSTAEPKVIVIESDECNSLVVANSFKDFVQLLLPYEDVFDTDGNLVYGNSIT